MENLNQEIVFDNHGGYPYSHIKDFWVTFGGTLLISIIASAIAFINGGMLCICLASFINLRLIFWVWRHERKCGYKPKLFWTLLLGYLYLFYFWCERRGL